MTERLRAAQDESLMDIAHPGHLDCCTLKPEASLQFFIDVLGVTQSGQQGNGVFLRGWDDYER